VEENKQYKNYFILTVSVILIFVSSLPVFLGFQYQSSDLLFSGFYFGTEDGNSYIAKMLSGAFGAWLFETPYSAYEQNGFFAFFPYILLGKLASMPAQRLQLIVLFHLFRMAGIVFLISQTYKFISIFLMNEKITRLATVIFLIGGGWGWINLFIGKRLPLEFYSPETFGFLMVLGLPHLCFARAFLLLSIRYFVNNYDKPEWKKNVLCSSCALFLAGIFQPMNLAIGFAILFCWQILLLITRKTILLDVLKRSFIWVILPGLFFIYNFSYFKLDPYLSSWESQNILLSPPIWDYLLSYGFGIFCLIYYSLFKNKYFDKIENFNFLIVWTIILPLLVYSPVNVQRRLAEGYWIVLSIFIANFLLGRKFKGFHIPIMVSLMLSQLLFLGGAITTIKLQQEPVYIKATLFDMCNYLYLDTENQDVILAPYEDSNVLPTCAPIKTLNGHGPESKNLLVLTEIIDTFYDGTIDKAEWEILREEFKIKYIIIPSEFEKTIAKEILYSYGEISFQNKDYFVVKQKDN
jgi:hypothetical protein